jgi:hypothetical protein
MGLSLGNVKTLIHRGKIALAERIRRREADAIAASAPARRIEQGRTNALLVV